MSESSKNQNPKQARRNKLNQLGRDMCTLSQIET